MDNRKMLKPLHRKTVVDGETWTYYIGNQHVLIMNPEQTQKTHIKFEDVLDIPTNEVWGSGRPRLRKPITPGYIREYISKHQKELRCK